MDALSASIKCLLIAVKPPPSKLASPSTCLASFGASGHSLEVELVGLSEVVTKRITKPLSAGTLEEARKRLFELISAPRHRAMAFSLWVSVKLVSESFNRCAEALPTPEFFA